MGDCRETAEGNASLTIGSYVLTSRFVLAPMAGITDAPFRKLCRGFGAGLTTSEMTTADIGLWRTPKSQRRLDLDLDAEPVAVQIAGSEPRKLAQAARAAVDRGAHIIDINMGCPAKKVCKRRAGSALLNDEPLVARILAAVVSAAPVPVTLKTRIGWDEGNKNGTRIARLAEQEGIRAITVHGRTRAAAFRGNADYDAIADIKQCVSIPVIANGDVTTPEKSLEVLKLTGADGLMIGRGARGRPWIFRQLNDFHRRGVAKTPVEKNELRDIMLDHLDDMHRFYGETTGVRVARKHLTWYCSSLADAAELRRRVVHVDSASEQLRLIREYFEREGDGISLAA